MRKDKSVLQIDISDMGSQGVGLLMEILMHSLEILGSNFYCMPCHSLDIKHAHSNIVTSWMTLKALKLQLFLYACVELKKMVEPVMPLM
jgi:hypothetical protein